MKQPEPKCPYCGAEMRITVQEFYGGAFCAGYAFCPQCGSYGPSLAGDIGKEEAVEKVRAAALRRPLQKPLTKEEMRALSAAVFEVVVYVETNVHVETYANIIYEMKIFDRYGETEGVDFLRFETYGKTWRAWAARPTDEERAAAPLEE